MDALSIVSKCIVEKENEENGAMDHGAMMDHGSMNEPEMKE